MSANQKRVRLPRLRPVEQADPDDNADAACMRVIASVRQKADRNELLSRWGTGLITLASALIPVSIILSTQYKEFLWGKALPAALAAAAAVAGGLLQIERPHERWRLYRGYQRVFETELLRYRNNVAPYDAGEPERTRRFVERLTSLQLTLHDDWSGLVPVHADSSSQVPPRLTQHPT
ncbi:MAG TPA: DUF4231 domain-containing protein [Solirubrobacteraceae bacterium]|nr:DUF4231 domain-containing protein [Solirubrobacteraceae bacterium]